MEKMNHEQMIKDEQAIRMMTELRELEDKRMRYMQQAIEMENRIRFEDQKREALIKLISEAGSPVIIRRDGRVDVQALNKQQEELEKKRMEPIDHDYPVSRETRNTMNRYGVLGQKRTTYPYATALREDEMNDTIR